MIALQSRKKWLPIAAAWLMVFASHPLYMCYANIVGESDFHWDRILFLWTYTLAFLALYLVHHIFLVPKILEKKNLWIYTIGTTICIACFTAFLVTHKPWNIEEHRLHLREHKETTFQTHKREWTHHNPDKGFPRKKDHLLLAPPELSRLTIALLMLIADIGLSAWAKSHKLRQKVLLLEQQTLKQELTQLRSQINPHFFMNTLNNIHALIDIDQERAKRAIIELSGMMRYSLYEGNESLAPLSHELEFMKLYIELMKLRFNNKVQLTFNLPESTPSSAQVPPLMLTTFVENAFKHGISYQHPSYLTITLETKYDNDHIHFRCENSRHMSKSLHEDGHYGMGLANVRKRLDIQYGNTYRLTIDEGDPAKFVVDLILPTYI